MSLTRAVGRGTAAVDTPERKSPETCCSPSRGIGCSPGSGSKPSWASGRRGRRGGLGCGRVPLALKRGAELRERGEVLGAACRGLAADDVLQRCDGDVQAAGERLAVGAVLQVLVAVGAVRPGGDVEIAGVGREVPDLAAGKQTRVGGKRDGRLARTRIAACSSLRASARRCRLSGSTAGVMSMSRVTM